MKIVTVVGARPQFIKAAMISRILRTTSREVLVHTGQHYDLSMSRVFFDELDIPEPDYNLGIGSESHARQTARMMMTIENVLLEEKPDVVLVYGDTNSTLAAALTASKTGIAIAHVESGPRMHDMTVPEEVNRVVTDHLSTLLFAPTQTSVDNLAEEGITRGVHFTGDVMYDAYLQYAPLAQEKSDIMQRLELKAGEYMYATFHRARNTDDPARLNAIVDALTSLDIWVVLPLHPRTRKQLHATGLMQRLAAAQNVTLCEPMGYLDSLMLTMNAMAVVTDSGGLQKEAYFASVPCVTLDDATAWPETLHTGWNTLVDCDPAAVKEAIKSSARDSMQLQYFGFGDAAHRMTGSIIEYFAD